MTNKLTNEAIITGLQAGDSEVFRYLYRAFGGMITGYVKKNKGNDQDAQEMVQIVLLECWQAVKANRYQEQGKLDRFIYMLTANTWRDELRKRKVRATGALHEEALGKIDDTDAELAVVMMKDQRIEAIHHCLQQLEAPCDQIVRLYHLEETSLLEISEKMNYDYNNLRKRIFDCRKKLKKLVDDYLKNISTT
jgi:RNA polymerase sigma factor (sigma-70 family)